MSAVAWDPLQREILDAMGLSAHRLVAILPSAMPSAPIDAAPLPVPTESAAQTPDHPLARALLRAAGRDPAAAEAAVLLRGWPTAQTLRGDPRAKRALWPQLRALRRRPG
jgi:DNA polymerase III psi subunit